jgi:prophage regulatory protein
MTLDATIPAQLLRLPDVMSRTGLARSTVWNLVAAGRFPKQVKLSERSSAWVSSEVDHWVTAKITERDLRSH